MFLRQTVWPVVAELMLYLMAFVLLLSVIVFILRGSMRKYKSADLKVFESIQPVRSHALDQFMITITFLGKHQFLIPANLLLIGLFLLIKSYRHYAFYVLVVSLSSLLLMFVLKHLFRRKRPEKYLIFAAKGKSFPSGHAIMAVTFYGLLLHVYLHNNIYPGLNFYVTVFTILLILLIGFSRIYLRVHYTSDVLAGFIIGGGWLYIGLFVLKQIA